MLFYLFVVGPPIIVEHLQKASYLVPKEKFTVCTADLALYWLYLDSGLLNICIFMTIIRWPTRDMLQIKKVAANL